MAGLWAIRASGHTDWSIYNARSGTGFGPGASYRKKAGKEQHPVARDASFGTPCQRGLEAKGDWLIKASPLRAITETVRALYLAPKARISWAVGPHGGP